LSPPAAVWATLSPRQRPATTVGARPCIGGRSNRPEPPRFARMSTVRRLVATFRRGRLAGVRRPPRLIRVRR